MLATLFAPLAELGERQRARETERERLLHSWVAGKRCVCLFTTTGEMGGRGGKGKAGESSAA